ncbi:GPI-anchor transamidase subunit GAA1 NDAI_0J01390 [Naumovozyma dairenensis CBS 421]|uniref:GPI transamidase component GAA1 n=1 Tax=Naumovozyma dairenensis (strain ATCC 10597 / BCRC 20456 / CBS 421 / NBRC 0211 / NRRL Y-12639) TaxID=1071378 RepID=G0WGV3_NAUDC|nr:hypothetical protein NDAI_0J01390 [Naumovozyma dairenensis CBS 421]CCD27031.1 hypothetical protein NDAI_0J01390 [Naumovozyma dairenensis CBS 421]
MGLLERVQRVIVSRGLIPKIMAQLPKISIIFVAISILMIAILPMDGQYRNTYISENALMPSQAYSYFRETEWNIVRGYRNELVHMENSTSRERNQIMESWLNEFGVKTQIYENRDNEVLYGVFHAPRGDGTEAIVLAVPWFNVDGEFNTNGAAVGVALARYFSRWPVWSKNIIVVFSENPDSALRSWVEAYYTSLDLTGGSIEAAIVLDSPGENDYFDYLEVYYDGLNGELPNLDLVNIGIYIAEHEGMRVSLHGTPFDQIKENNYWTRLKILVASIQSSAFSGLTKTHGNEAFSGWRIQSITLKTKGNSGPLDITCFGRVPEAMFRSINNLLEKFHQSFFFYLLLAPRQFVSISSYLPSAVILSVAFVIAFMDSYINNPSFALPFFSNYTLIPAIVWTVTLVACFILAQLFLILPIPSLLLLINIVISISSIIIQNKKLFKPAVSNRLRSFAFLHLSLILTSLLMVNFPLSFMIGLMAFPMTKVRSITANTAPQIKLENIILLMISNPFIALIIYNNVSSNSGLQGLQGLRVINRLISAWKDMRCWTWFVLCLGWLPSWIMVAISVIENEREPTSHDVKKNE